MFPKSRQKSLSPEKIADKTIENYLKFLTDLKKRGFKIIINGPHCGGGNVPGSISSEIERNNLCAYVNDKLALECSKKINFFTLFDLAVDQITMENISNLYKDNHHLKLPEKQTNEIGISLARLACERIKSSSTDHFQKYSAFQKKEVTANLRIISSNIPNWNCSDYSPGKRIMFNEFLKKDKEYMALIELPFGINLSEVILALNSKRDSINTTVIAVDELFNLSKEYTRKNLLKLREIFNENNEETIKRHSSEGSLPEETTCKYVLIKIVCNIKSVKLLSVRITRRID